jgi:branched-chain amino acid transport system permease protein
LGPYILSGLIFIVCVPFMPLYVQDLMTKVLIFAIFGMSLDLLLGYTGLFNLGHATFFGVAAYTTGVLMVKLGIESFWISSFAGIFMATLVGAVFGVVALRVSGIYFMLVTLAIGQLFYAIAWGWKWLSSASHEGIFGIPHPDIAIPWFTWDIPYFYYFVFLVFVICWFLLYRLVNSPFGCALKGIRENEPRMHVLGYNTWLYKYVAIVVSALFAGVAGVLFAYFYAAIVPSYLGLYMSGLVLLMVMLGGPGTLFGAIAGALVLTFSEFYVSVYYAERWPLILGILFVISVMVLRGGIAFQLAKLWKRVSYPYEGPKS